MKLRWNSGEALVKLRWNSGQTPVKLRSNSGETLVKLRWSSGEALVKLWWNSGETLVKFWWNSGTSWSGLNDVLRLRPISVRRFWIPEGLTRAELSCAIYTHTPARKSSTNFQLYYFVIQICSTNWLGHGHGYKWHSSLTQNFHEIPCGHENSTPEDLHVYAYVFQGVEFSCPQGIQWYYIYIYI